MKRNLLLPVFAALILTIFALSLVSTTAQAQGEGPLKRLLKARAMLGMVTAVGDGEFSIEKMDGTVQTIKVDDTTRFFNSEKQQLSIDDLIIGQYAAVVTGRRFAENLQARIVLILPQDFDPSQFEGIRGRITEININENTFTLESRNGEEKLVRVDDETRFRDQIEKFEDLETGMTVGVVLKETEAGDVVARIVRAGYMTNRIGGEIIEVDEASGAFVVRTRMSGEELTVKVDGNTRFRSKGGKITGISDLKTGMVVLVLTENPAGAGDPILASVVAAGSRADLPKFNRRPGGRIISL